MTIGPFNFAVLLRGTRLRRAVDPGDLCQPSGPDGKGQARGQARNARGEPPDKRLGTSVAITLLTGTTDCGDMKLFEIARTLRAVNDDPGLRTFKVTARMTAELYPSLTNARRWNFEPALAATCRTATHRTSCLKAPTVLWDRLDEAIITMECRADDPPAAGEIVKSIIRRTAEFTGEIRIHDIRIVNCAGSLQAKDQCQRSLGSVLARASWPVQ